MWLVAVHQGGVNLHEHLAGQVLAGDLDTAQADARFPAHEGHGGGGIDLQAGGVVERSIDQLRQLAAVFASHDAGTDASGEDVGDRLADVCQAVDGAAGMGVHCGFPVVAPPGMTPPWV